MPRFNREWVLGSSPTSHRKERPPATTGRSNVEDEAVLVVVVHDLEQARAVLAAAAEVGCAVELRSAPGAAGYAGVGYLRALGEAVGCELWIDCGDDPGLVMAALRTGCSRLGFSGSADAARRLCEMAEQAGAVVVHETQAPDVLELAPDDDAAAMVRARMAGPRREALS